MNQHLFVIIPVYNVEMYLTKCLDSIVSQTFRNLSIICVNDGSTDNSESILKQYSKIDDRIHVITTENRGLSAARNVALDYIQSQIVFTAKDLVEYITFVDSDDYLEHDAFEVLLSQFSEDVDIISYGHQTVDCDGKLIKEYNSNGAGFVGLCKINEDVFRTIVPNATSKIFKAELIFKNQIKFPNGLLYEDNYFTTVYLLFCNNIFFCDRYFYHYLIRDNSIMGLTKSKKPGCVISYILLSEHLYSFLKKNNLFERFYVVFWDFFYRLTISGVTFAPSKDEEDELYTRAKALIESVGQAKSNDLWMHYNYLISTRQFKEYTKHSLFGILKHKHRANYDKFYFLGLPLLTYTYTISGRRVKLFSLLSLS